MINEQLAGVGKAKNLLCSQGEAGGWNACLTICVNCEGLVGGARSAEPGSPTLVIKGTSSLFAFSGAASDP